MFAGHSGWAGGQLEAEVARGDWLIWPGDAGTVFDPVPDGVWPRLIRRDSDLLAGFDGSPGSPAHQGWASKRAWVTAAAILKLSISGR